MTTLTQQQKEHRHSEFSRGLQYATDHYLEAAAGDILESNGWRWQPRHGEYLNGWWILPGSEHETPRGDCKPIGIRAYTTVQLYTEVEYETVEKLAGEFRQSDRRRGLKF